MGVGSCAYVGGELYTNFGNNNVGISDEGHTKNTLKSTYNLGGKVRLGYTVSQQAMIFVGLGMERAKFQLKTVTDQVKAGTYKKNKSAFTFAPSVGMDMFVNKNLFIRGEFTYVLAAKLKVDGAANRAAPLRATTNDTAKVSMNQQRFTLGLGYKF
jgi:opacity protein-like surface antigen